MLLLVVSLHGCGSNHCAGLVFVTCSILSDVAADYGIYCCVPSSGQHRFEGMVCCEHIDPRSPVQVIGMDECRKRLRKVGRKGVEGSSSDFYFASLDGNLVLDAGEACRLLW